MTDFCRICGNQDSECRCAPLQHDKAMDFTQPVDPKELIQMPNCPGLYCRMNDWRIFRKNGMPIGINPFEGQPRVGAITSDEPALQPSRRGNVEEPMNKGHIQGENLFTLAGDLVASVAMLPRRQEDLHRAEANIAACRKAIEAFHPHASPHLLKEISDCVDRYEADVRKRLEHG